MARSYVQEEQPLVTLPDVASGKSQTTAAAYPTPATDMVYDFPQKRAGQVFRKRPLYALDVVALLISLACATAALVAVTNSLPYAAKLGYTKQIVVVGFLLGVMNQCLQRVLPYACLLLEARLGPSTLQNFDGLTRWSPLADRLAFVWRSVIVLSLLLPLGLGVVYKRFTNGAGTLELPSISGSYSPTAPPGLQNVGGTGIMANATTPFLAASDDSAGLPEIWNGSAAAYGFNALLLSNTSAAALDGPLPHVVSDLQHQLQSNSAYYILGAPVRGTVATYNATVETHRDNEAFWKKYLSVAQLKSQPIYNGYYFGVLSVVTPTDNSLAQWDSSWIFAGTFGLGVDPSDGTAMQEAFQQTAMGFDVTRNQCYGEWRITRSSVELVGGGCSEKPLAWKYQYYDDCQLALSNTFFSMLQETLGPFATTRNQSHWRLPTYALSIASMYQSDVAKAQGYVPIQSGGSLYMALYNSSVPKNQDNPSRGNPGWFFNETYVVANSTLTLTVNTLRPAVSLYIVLLVQPLLTLAALAIAAFLYKTPIIRGFGLVAVLAGVECDSLGVVSGAESTGKADRHIRLRVETTEVAAKEGLDADITVRYVLTTQKTGTFRGA